MPGEARLGAIGIDVDLPTALRRSGGSGVRAQPHRLPAARRHQSARHPRGGRWRSTNSTTRCSTWCCRWSSAQADTAAPDSVIAAVGGLLGLKSGDAIPDFPITALARRTACRRSRTGCTASSRRPAAATTGSATWRACSASRRRQRATPSASTWAATPTCRSTCASTPDRPAIPASRRRSASSSATRRARVEARADLFDVDLVTGAARALPQFGVWAAAGHRRHRACSTSPARPVARADTLRIGFALDAQRRLTFVLAADNVVLGAHTYPTLDLTSPDAVMDAVGNTVERRRRRSCSATWAVRCRTVRLLIGLDAPAGITADHAAGADDRSGRRDQRLLACAVRRGRRRRSTTVLAELRNALADAGSAASADPRHRHPRSIRGACRCSGRWRSSSRADGHGTDDRPRGRHQRRHAGPALHRDRHAHRAPRSPSSTWQRARPACCRASKACCRRANAASTRRASRLPLGSGAALTATGVGLRLGWTPAGGLSARRQRAQPATGHRATSACPIALPVDRRRWHRHAAAGRVGRRRGAGRLPRRTARRVRRRRSCRRSAGPTMPHAGGALPASVRAAPRRSRERPRAGAARLAAATGDERTRAGGADAAGRPVRRQRREPWLHRRHRPSGRPVPAGRSRDGLPNLAVWFPPAGLERAPRRRTRGAAALAAGRSGAFRAGAGRGAGGRGHGGRRCARADRRTATSPAGWPRWRNAGLAATDASCRPHRRPPA